MYAQPEESQQPTVPAPVVQLTTKPAIQQYEKMGVTCNLVDGNGNLMLQRDIDAEVGKALMDCEKRARIKKPRIIRITLQITPHEKEDGPGAQAVSIRPSVSLELPPRDYEPVRLPVKQTFGTDQNGRKILESVTAHVVPPAVQTSLIEDEDEDFT